MRAAPELRLCAFNLLKPPSEQVHLAVCPTRSARQDRARDLEDRICALAAHIDAATFRWLELVREYDESGGWAGDGILSCAPGGG